MDNVASVSLSKHTAYSDGVATGKYVVAVVKAADTLKPLDVEKIKLWLSVRTKSVDVKVVEEK